ncbi:MAG: cytochrome c [Bacteroidetes bacterium]|nr:MAG: cytochrome c [Bacteroidota bacterium]MBL1143433.1 cytochrome c [Bacteroidota bacterium]MCB0802570.1 cytochrome c [Flavobacteriales bacterium]NOG56237.1 cytochrome c [Bacteroidota bacterium]
MKTIKNTITALFTGTLLSVLLVSCADSQSPGVEFMPDMYRSSAIEPYVDYNFPDSATTLQSPENSIPRGYTPYPYENTIEGFELAGQNLKNPLQLTEKTIEEGKLLYNNMCSHCHGKKGKGEGTITNPIYGSVPSYLDKIPNRRGNRAMVDLNEGHIYHTIMYGLNAMGPHSSQIREQDRWKIVAYVQILQGKDPMNVAKATDVVIEADSLK